MATGLSPFVANGWLDALGNSTPFSVGAVWVQLHVGDPGAAGTANPATETARRQVSFAAASGASLVSDADVSWVNISGGQDAEFFSAWSAATTGNFLFSGTIVSDAYTAGDTFTIPSGSLSVSLAVAS